ncbi:TPA: phosphatase PAP2 family protein [Legionella pneumophila]|uniref:Inositolphosphotransferase Aur1/Ipt1 domain-containing protein n=1 Tax=Legionella pneumophila TaxID=446 RepID=A0A378K945_LEGPN|nr:phosphatase PAP2 family protein [Legionella pneumophila]MCW8433898.1 phosphatase PAP2 family protein [Legionella pneumophila]MCW8467495.1 phosphatase PAP2 family protein [Legionella pneumophila]MCW8477162.1 phosphatase PAP2 family protein [Legionella pneumophila]MCZ4680957.1 phosphatase PAP2 family protein [Legionella pneumophila]MCZ4687705.1 phosphatase PAP2 family protein [Legionella pneumophila]
MQVIPFRYFILLAGTIVSLSLVVLVINHFIYQFPGNNYFPPNTPVMACIILLNYIGLILFFGKKNRVTCSGLELINFFIVMSIIALATNAVQLTPYPPIDKQIIKLEAQLGINMISILEWTNKYQHFKYLLAIIYDTLPYQMSILPLCVIVSGRFYILKDYYFLLLCTTLMGFSYYYFFPTTAPASELQSSLFAPEQIATGFKFHQIHNHIHPTTIEGGLIALPSFHTIWAILCVYLIKDWFIPCLLLSIINVLLILSCVLLGWHYPIDILAAIILVGLSYYLLTVIKVEARYLDL